MKIALMFYGQPRCYNLEGYKTIQKYLLNAYDCDVYCHMWWNRDEYENNELYDIRFESQYIPMEPNVPENITNLYSPVSLVADKKFVIQDTKYLVPDVNVDGMRGAISQLYSIYSASRLVEWGKYDWVIKLRYDSRINKLPNLHTLNPKLMYTSDDADGTHSKVDTFDDNFWILNYTHKEMLDVYLYTNVYRHVTPFHLEYVYLLHSKVFGIFNKITTLPISEFSTRFIRNPQQSVMRGEETFTYNPTIALTGEVV